MFSYTCTYNENLALLPAVLLCPWPSIAIRRDLVYQLFRTIVIMHVTLLSQRKSNLLFHSNSARCEKTNSKKLAEIMYSSRGYRTAQHIEKN